MISLVAVVTFEVSVSIKGVLGTFHPTTDSCLGSCKVRHPKTHHYSESTQSQTNRNGHTCTQFESTHSYTHAYT